MRHHYTIDRYTGMFEFTTDMLLPGGPPMPPRGCAMCWREQRKGTNDMLGLVNQARADHGIEPLIIHPDLMASAQAKAEDMCNRDYFSHTDPDGNPPTNYENIAMRYNSTLEVFEGWRESHGHHVNMVEPHYQYFGFGEFKSYWCQHFH